MTNQLEKIIADELRLLYPELKPYQVERYSQKYVNGVLEQLSRWSKNPRNECFSVDSRELNRLCGRMKDNAYLFPFMDRSERTRLVDVRYRGNTGFYKQVTISERYHDLVMDRLSHMIAPTPSQPSLRQQAIAEQATDWIPVNEDSITSFIVASQRRLAESGLDKDLKQAIMDEVHAARRILGMSEIHEGGLCFPEVWRQADTGRRYGLNNSLQRQPQRVRHAALGPCHKYDFVTNSFAVMASLACQIDPTIKIGAVRDFMGNRTRMREFIARETGLPVSVIKEVFTAVGFGAESVDNPYKAVRSLIRSQAHYDRLVSNQHYQWIEEEFKHINSVISEHFPREDFEFLGGYRYQHRDATTGRAKKDGRRLAWIYQNVESHLTRQAQELIHQATGQQPLMTVHDCLYYQQPIPASVLVDTQLALREQFEFVRLEHEAIWPIGTPERFAAIGDSWQQEELEHRARIQQEEHEAQGFRMPEFNSVRMPTHEQQAQSAWQQRRAEIEAGPDVGDYEYEYDWRDEHWNSDQWRNQR